MWRGDWPRKGYGDVRPWRPPFHASPAVRKGPISSKRVSSQDPLLRKFGNFSLYSLNFHLNFSSQASKFRNFQFTSPKFGNFSSQAPKFGKFQFTSPPFQRQISVRKPHTSEIWAAHPYLKKSWVPPWDVTHLPVNKAALDKIHVDLYTCTLHLYRANRNSYQKV